MIGGMTQEEVDKDLAKKWAVSRKRECTGSTSKRFSFGERSALMSARFLLAWLQQSDLKNVSCLMDDLTDFINGSNRSI